MIEKVKLAKLLYILLLSLFLVLSSACHSSSQPQDSNNCERLADICKQHDPYPYVWGGESIQEGGFDCSGFVYSVAKKYGRPIPRTTSRKYWLMNKHESTHWNRANCGALIWWTLSEGRPYGHVGIHIQKPSIWQSGSSTGPELKKLFKGSYWIGIR